MNVTYIVTDRATWSDYLGSFGCVREAVDEVKRLENEDGQVDQYVADQYDIVRVRQDGSWISVYPRKGKKMEATKKAAAATAVKSMGYQPSKLLSHRLNWKNITILILALTPVFSVITSLSRGYFAIGGEWFVWIAPLVMAIEQENA